MLEEYKIHNEVTKENGILIKLPNDYYNESNISLRELFEKQVKLTPNNTALEIGDNTLSYNELSTRSNNFAVEIQKRIDNTTSTVGVLMNYSEDLVISLIALLKLGLTYVPIDPIYPDERINYILTDCDIKFIIVEKNLAKNYKDVTNIYTEDLNNVNSDIYSNLYNLNNQDTLCVIYTSGTTGRPKGINVEDIGISNYIEWRSNKYNITKEDKILQLISISFDGFLSNFYTALLNGATLVLPVFEKWRDFKYISNLINKKQITSMSIVPLMYKEILNNSEEGSLTSLKTVVLAGEKATSSLIKLSNIKAKNTLLINEYGPTENSVATTSYIGITEDTVDVIGTVMSKNIIYILTKRVDEITETIRGELCISGIGLSNGYINNNELTMKKFINNPFIKNDVIYRTGDIVQLLDDGNLKYIGREDNQIKINGHRVEIEEIKKVILENSQIDEIEILCETNDSGFKYLDAYVTSEHELNINQILDTISKKLPFYMIPSDLYKIDKFPTNANGKADITKLYEFKKLNTQNNLRNSSNTEIENNISEIWTKILNKNEIGRNDNFFNLGGNSMLIMEAYSEIDKVYPDVLTVPDLFKYTTIHNISSYIDSKINDANEFHMNFIHGNGSINKNKEYLNLTISDATPEKIDKICAAESITSNQFFESVYAAVIAKLYNTNLLSLLIDKKSKVEVVDIDFNTCNTFSEIFNLVKESKYSISIDKLESVLENYEKDIVVMYEEYINQSVSNLCDIILRLDNSTSDFKFTIEYNLSKVDEEMIKKFSLTFNNVLIKICNIY